MQSRTRPPPSISLAGTSLEPLFFWKKDHSLREAVDFATSTAATLTRLGSGAIVAHVGKRPGKIFELYDRESSPACRKVREALSILDLNVIVHPCPVKGQRFRKRVEERVGRYAVPLFVDPNAGLEFSSPDAIVHHLFETYGDGTVPLPLRPGALLDSMSHVASMLRGSKGQDVLASRAPDQLLDLYGYEASPYCRMVREALTELELPYMLHNLARGSVKRSSFATQSGKMQFPYLVDAARGVAMFESRDIVKYLYENYAETRQAA